MGCCAQNSKFNLSLISSHSSNWSLTESISEIPKLEILCLSLMWCLYFGAKGRME
ncbi:hypothetical protein BCR42DRAFT_425466 [Absidia repens]|uniref:Uncharacterized protein n=1 Tax=Absidia repens TaxID=90262 RepID=A0A1X2I305_9FUNG|nr:hypothetical protein BCR42DRAFT_425466 [Absidia repens]